MRRHFNDTVFDDTNNDPNLWAVHPHMYMNLLVKQCFRMVEMRIPLIISSYFVGSKMSEGKPNSKRECRNWKSKAIPGE